MDGDLWPINHAHCDVALLDKLEPWRTPIVEPKNKKTQANAWVFITKSTFG